MYIFEKQTKGSFLKTQTKMRYLFTVLFLAAFFFSHAGDTTYYYYDYHYIEIKKEEASIFRKVIKTTDLTYSVWDYYQQNRIRMTGSYLDSKMLVKNGEFVYYFPNGKVEKEGEYQNDALLGVWTHYFMNGNLKSKGEYNSEKKKIGQWEFGYINGQLKEKGSYSNDDTVGLWQYWFEEGGLESKGAYNSLEEKDGYWEFWHPNGEIESHGEYLNGKRTGKWEYFYNDGKTDSFGNYIDDKKKGEWKFYFEEGAISAIENYKADSLMNYQFWDKKGKKLKKKVKAISPPYFKGGKYKFSKYLSDHIIYPNEAYEKGIQGRVFITFVV
jgi:antitoxin component YwqK of YwqJK toxin-antitoxin module